jgi:hypothetical protein
MMEGTEYIKRRSALQGYLYEQEVPTILITSSHFPSPNFYYHIWALAINVHPSIVGPDRKKLQRQIGKIWVY